MTVFSHQYITRKSFASVYSSPHLIRNGRRSDAFEIRTLYRCHFAPSITNYTHSEALDDDLVVAPLVDDASSLSDADVVRIEKVALNAVEIAGRLVAHDGRAAGVAINFILPENAAEAVRYTFNTVGHALWTTTAVLSAGFLVFATSGFEVSWALGLLVTTTIVFALVADFLLLPTLLIAIDRRNS